MIETLIWLVPAAVLAAGLREPRGGLLVLAACLPLFGSPPGGPYLTAFEVAALAAAATAWRAGPAPRSRLDLPVWAFIGVTAASLVPVTYSPPSWHPRVLLRLVAALPGVEPWTPLYGWRALASLLVGAALYVGVKRAFAGRSVRPLCVALGAGMGFTLLLGLAAHADLIELEAFRVKGGPIWETRLHSLFFHSGWLAEYLVVALPPAVAGLLSLGSRGRLAAVSLVALALPVTFLTEQRGAWFSLGGQLVLAAVLWGPAVLRRPAGRRAVLASVMLVLAVVGVSLGVEPDLYSDAAERTRQALAGYSRLFIWSVATSMTVERPVLGWGAGAFSPVYHEVMNQARPLPFDWLTAHNQYLMLTVERGLLGLVAFALVLWALLESLLAAGRSSSTEQLLAVRGLLLSFAGFLAYGVVQYMFYLRMIEWLFWMLAGAVAVLAPLEAGRRPIDRAAQATLLIAALLVPWRALAVEPMTVPGNRSFGFHEVEQSGERSFQWTEGYAARRLPRRRGSTELEIELANGHPVSSRHRLEVVVRVDGRPGLRSEVGGEWRRFAIALDPSQRDHLLLEIEARPTFRPFSDFRRYPELDESLDIRRLGVAVSLGAASVPRSATQAEESQP